MRTLLRDTGTVFTRALRISLRNPAWLLISLMQPILYILLFGPLLKPLSGQLGAAGNPYQIFVPGILIQVGMFGARGRKRRRARDPQRTAGLFPF